MFLTVGFLLVRLGQNLPFIQCFFWLLERSIMFYHYASFCESSKKFHGQGWKTNKSQNLRSQVKLCLWAATAWGSCAEYASDVRCSLRVTGFSCSNTILYDYHIWCHDRLRLTMECWDKWLILFMAWSVPDHIKPGIIQYARFHFCQNPGLLMAVMWQVKGIFFNFALHFSGIIEVKNHAHNTHNQMERSCSEFVDTGTVSIHFSPFTRVWLHGFACLKQLCPLHAIPITCSSHTLPHWYIMHALQSLIWCY